MTEDDRDTVVPGLAATALANALTDAVGVYAGGPGGAAIAGAAAPYLAAFFQWTLNALRAADRAGRIGEMLQSAGEERGLPAEQLAELASRSPRTRFMTEAAIQAAADTYWPGGVRAIGKALAAGYIQAEDSLIDIPKMVLPAMTEMIASHVQVLDLLVMCRWDRMVTRRGVLRIDVPANAHLARIKSDWTAQEMKAALPSLGPVLGSVIGTLERYGLIERNDTTAETLAKFSEATRGEAARVNPPGRKVGLGYVQTPPPVLDSITAQQIAPPPSWSPTELGRQVLAYYELAGFTSDEVTTPQADGRPA